MVAMFSRSLFRGISFIGRTKNIQRLSYQSQNKKGNQSVVMYVVAGGITMIGVTYAGVPIYRKYCQASGYGGNSEFARASADRVEEMETVHDRKLTVEFTADINSTMVWNFKPQQAEVKVCPGETALAFYTARNPTDVPITGIATYNVLPVEAGKYFNKIQCFCFEEQRLNPNEEVDMPVFFYIDPEYDEDPRLVGKDHIMLSYTFFEAKEGLKLPLPGYATS